MKTEKHFDCKKKACVLPSELRRNLQEAVKAFAQNKSLQKHYFNASAKKVVFKNAFLTLPQKQLSSKTLFQRYCKNSCLQKRFFNASAKTVVFKNAFLTLLQKKLPSKTLFQRFRKNSCLQKHFFNAVKKSDTLGKAAISGPDQKAQRTWNTAHQPSIASRKKLFVSGG